MPKVKRRARRKHGSERGTTTKIIRCVKEKHFSSQKDGRREETNSGKSQ